MKQEERIKMVKAMEYICRQINDEEVFEPWLMLGVADDDIPYGDLSPVNNDGALEYYIWDKHFAELMGCFLRRMSAARRSGGLYCDGILSEGE